MARYSLLGATMVGTTLVLWPLALSLVTFVLLVALGTDGLNRKATQLVWTVSAGMTVALFAFLVSQFGFMPDRQ